MDKAAPYDGLPSSLTSSQLRWALGVTNSRLEQLTTAGIITRVEKGKYSIDSIPRYVKFQRDAQQGPSDWRSVRTALLKEKLSMVRLDRAERQGQVARIEDFVSIVRALFLLVRNRALALPSKIVPRLYAASSRARMSEILDYEVREWLTELSETRVMNSLTRRNGRGNPQVEEPHDEHVDA
jgi:hypothetical protein